jgi:hypothetical protein
VNFDGTGTPAIRSSYNVSSVTKNGIGDYTVNFATPMADANYSMGGGVLSALLAFGGVIDLTDVPSSTSSKRIRTIYSLGNGAQLYDSTLTTFFVFGN